VQPSSLIFVALIAIWAAYLLQHWVRRREHLATARSVDRFSDAMRVLERRSALPEPDLAAPSPRSYAVSPARPSRPEVVVKRALSPKRDVEAAPVRPTRIFHVLAGISSRRLRGVTLLASLLLVLVVSSLAIWSVMPAWSVPVVLAVLVSDVAWLRHVSVSERAGRARARAGRSALGPSRPPARHAGFFEVDSDAGSQTQPRSEPEPRSQPAAAASAAIYDVEAAVTIEPSVDVDPPEVDLSAWAPVPVPPPTYTLKAKAADPVTAPTAVTEHLSGEPWSLEGMVYDCDLDELVERRSATGA